MYCGLCSEECMSCEQPAVNTALSFTNRVTVILAPPQETSSVGADRKARIVSTIAMLDTGATESDFISRTLANELVSEGGEIRLGSSREICSAFGNRRCVNTNEIIDFTLTLFNTISNKYEDIKITARVIDDLKVELVVGLQTMGTHSLLEKLLPKLVSANRNRTRGHIEATGGLRPKAGKMRPTAGNTKPSPSQKEGVEKAQEQHGSSDGRYKRGKGSKPTCGEHPRDCELCALLMSSMSFFGDAEGDDAETDPYDADSRIDLAEQLRHSREAHSALEGLLKGSRGLSDNDIDEILDSISFNGSESMRARLREVCRRYIIIFRREVGSDPALLPPMELEIDADKLRRTRSARNTPRPQSPTKLMELKKMIEDLLRLGVLRVSTAETGSQVLLVAKKGTKKLRFCIDFRALNDATTNPSGWPIPNIGEMLQRLGAHRPKFFGVMDLTAGFHQAPLSESAKRWTAFTTAFGMFEWNRVPMGLKGAPSYFQHMMMVHVLGDLLQKAVEVYLDDFIVFGVDEDEFIANVEAVFERCLKAKITLNPDKCRFGLEEIEYVGHTINQDGLTFERARLDRILEIPKPTTKGAMKIFLGACNYFHAHVKGMSVLEAPLQELCGGDATYTKKMRAKPLVWNAEADAAFEAIMKAIDACPTLFFVNPEWKIYLQTDASEYGLGAYLFQVDPADPEIHRPIEFLSKTFSKAQKRWGIPDKEAYAIFYALQKWEHLLRDNEFILETDHKNLTYLNYAGSDKVKRWKMLIQEFKFDIQFIKGVDNIVSDAWSRLCSYTATGVDPDDVSSTWAAGGGPSEELDSLEFRVDVEARMEMEAEFPIIDVSSAFSFEELCAMEVEYNIDPKIREQLLTVHNAVSGHVGLKRTVNRLKRKGVKCKHMRGMALRFIRECSFCQKQCYLKSLKHSVPYTVSSQRVMQRLGIDTIGPMEADRYGFQHILVIIDSFSRWVMCYPLRSTSAEEFIRAFLQHCGTFGRPLEILTDNGSQLKNAQVEEFVLLLHTQHLFTVAYSKQENSMVERANKEIFRYIRSMAFEENSRDCWSDYLPFAQRICNAEVVSSLGVSPAQIMFGNAVDLDRGILTPNVMLPEHSHADMSEYVNGLVEAQRRAINVANEVQGAKDSKHMATAPKHPITEFGVGSYVTTSYPAGLKGGPPSKLMTHRKGPLLVVSKKGSFYTLMDLIEKKTITVHIDHLEEFRYDKAHVDPAFIAAKDTCEFFVESVLDHEPKLRPTKNRKDLEFLIKWRHYPGKDSWVPWRNLTKNEFVHEYCRQNHMKSLIDRRYALGEGGAVGVVVADGMWADPLQ